MSDRPICAVANAERIGERELFQHAHPSPILEFEIIKLYPVIRPRGPRPRANWPAVELRYGKLSQDAGTSSTSNVYLYE